MFDTTIHKTETRVTPVTRILEKSVSPDKVAEIYELVRQEVIGQIIEVYTINSNSFKAIVIECYQDARELVVVFKYGFEVNGKKYHGELKHNPDFIERPDEIVTTVFKQFINVLFDELKPVIMPKLILMAKNSLKV